MDGFSLLMLGWCIYVLQIFYICSVGMNYNFKSRTCSKFYSFVGFFQINRLHIDMHKIKAQEQSALKPQFGFQGDL